MARISILRKDGTASRYFWMDTDTAEPTQKTVYKRTSDGIKRMRGVHFDPASKQIVKH